MSLYFNKGGKKTEGNIKVSRHKKYEYFVKCDLCGTEYCKICVLSHNLFFLIPKFIKKTTHCAGFFINTLLRVKCVSFSLPNDAIRRTN